uniref:Uncharacterized protein n=1 Tax=Anguilla anguilla TaxID=7936 RepID=A0A0E9VG63_ANGAN
MDSGKDCAAIPRVTWFVDQD